MTVSIIYYPTQMKNVRRDSLSFIQLMVGKDDAEILCSQVNLPTELEVRDQLSVWEVDNEYSSLLITLLYGTSVIENEKSAWDLINVLKYAYDVFAFTSFNSFQVDTSDQLYWTRSFETILKAFVRSPRVQERALEVLKQFIWEYPKYVPETLVDTSDPVFYFPSSFVLHYKLARSIHYEGENAEMMSMLLTELSFRLSEKSVNLDALEEVVRVSLDSIYDSQYADSASERRLRKQLWLDYLERVIFSLVGHQHSTELFRRIASLRHPVWQEVYHSKDEIIEWTGVVGRDRYTQQICWDESGFPTGYSTAAANYRGND